MRVAIFILYYLLLSLRPAQETKEIYVLTKGRLSFRSEAPLELIQASSDRVQAALDVSKNTFAFAVNMETFSGFNSELQREHFCEKFMECAQFPKSTFQGKIIEEIDFSQAGVHEVRAKGKFAVHGVEQERIIRGKLEIDPGGIRIEAAFTVPLEDHNIDIPKVVNQNIAEVIVVEIQSEFFPK